MGMLEDIMKVLDRWEVWREVQKLPEKLEALERRIGELEQKIGGKWPPDVCKFCGERSLRLHQTYPADAKGKIEQIWECGSCGKFENRVG
jgi:hypothetical protein